MNRAPVLTPWAAVAERLGVRRNEALTLGRAVAGLNAQSKGRRLDIFKPDEEKAATARKKELHQRFLFEVCGRAVSVINTEDDVRATMRGKLITSASVEGYFQWRFGDGLVRVREVAKAYRPNELAMHT